MTDEAPLDITVTSDGDAVRISLAGELDVHTAPGLGHALTTAQDAGATAVEVDASALMFCDSSGIQVLVQARERAVADGGHFKVSGVHGSVEKVLSVTGLLELFS